MRSDAPPLPLKRARALAGEGRAPAVRAARRSVALTFFLTGVVFATWAARIPAIKGDLGLSDGQLTIAFMGLNAGAIGGLQLGDMLVSQTGSRPALRAALPLFAAALVAIALAPDLVTLTAAVFCSAAANSVVDVAMNAHGVAVERRLGRPVLSGLHAMHPLGGMVGAGLGAIAAHAGAPIAAHFAAVAAVVAAAAIVGTHRLLPAAVDAARSDGESIGPTGTLIDWLHGWSGRILLLGVLAFCLTLAEGGALDWGAVYLRDTLGASPGVAAGGVAAFLAAMTLGRLLGDGLTLRYGPAAMVRAGTLVAGPGFGLALLLETPAAGIVGLLLLGAGISFLLPLIISAAGAASDEASAAAVARVSTLGYLGSFLGPALIGSLAGFFGLAAALALPAALVTLTALGAKRVRTTAGTNPPGEPA